LTRGLPAAFVAPGLLFILVEMTTALELLYEYRHLMGKCSSGAGLDMDEIQAVDAIEGVFADESASEVGRESLGLTTTLRSGRGKVCDQVQLSSVLLDRLVLKGCPWIESDAVAEIVIEDPELMLSYRFMGKVAWTREEPGALLTIGLVLIGVPVLVRRGPKSERSAQAAAAPRRRRRITPRAVAA